jgi:hypothetical protein
LINPLPKRHLKAGTKIWCPLFLYAHWHYDCTGLQMENNFKIDHEGQKVEVDYTKGDKPNEHLFTVQLSEGPLKLQCKKDSDGAYRWLDEEGKATEQSTDIGTMIETYMIQQKIDL